MAPVTRRAFIQSAIIVSAVPASVRHDEPVTVVNCVVRPPAPMIGAWSLVGSYTRTITQTSEASPLGT